MADQKPDPPKSSSSSDAFSGGTRPYATLDLKATEIKVTPIERSASTPRRDDPSAAAKAPGPAPASTYAQKPTATAGTSMKSDAIPKGETMTESKSSDAASAKKPTASAAAPASSPGNTPAPEIIEVRKRGGVISHLTAGLFGGFLALAGAEWVLPQMNIDGATSRLADNAASLAERIDGVERSLPNLKTAAGPAGGLGEAEGRIVNLEKSVAAIPELKDSQARLVAETKAALAAAASDEGVPEQLTRLSALEGKIKALEDTGASDPNAGRVPQLAALTGKVADLETNLGTQLSELRKSVAADVEGRLRAATEASEAAKSGTQRIDRDVAGVKSDTIRFEERLLAAKAETDRAAAALKLAQEESASIKADLAALKSGVAKPADISSALSPVSQKVAELDQRVQSLNAAEADRKTNSERIVLALELQNLKRTLESGRPYASELESVAKVAGPKLDLAALNKFKDDGVPPLADLNQDFRAAANAAIDAAAEPAEGSVVDRLIAGAKSVVRVRKINHAAEDKTAEAVIGRMQIALNEGRLEDVLTESKNLPAKAQDPVRPLLDKVAARVAVERAVANLEGQLKTSLGSAPAPAPVVTP